MISQFDLNNQLVKYLASETSLERFRDWFDSSTWDMHLTSDQPTQDLAAEIELRLAEYTNGHRTEGELRTTLLPLVTLQIYGQPAFGITSTSATAMSRAAIPGPAVDIRIEKVFA
jgi:hypothetical protein